MIKQTLFKKARHHETKAKEYYSKLEAMERKEMLIGFRTKNDNRISTDKHQIILDKLEFRDEYYYDNDI